MKQYWVEVCYHATAVKMGFDSKESAQAAYRKLCRALEAYRAFKNDKMETVEVDAASGPSTFRLERMDAILFNSDEKWEEEMRGLLEREKIARALREELGLPEITKR